MIPKQTKNIWKWSKHDNLIPVTNFMDGIEVEDTNKAGSKAEKIKGAKDKDNTTKITVFRGKKMDDTMIKHSEILEKAEKSK